MTREQNRFGVELFVLSEAVFFLLLILAYVFYHHRTGTGGEAAAHLDPVRTGIYSVFLLASSATMWRAEANAKRSRRRSVRIWLLATIVLGAVFLIGQGREYADLIQRKVTISRDLFGTTFFTLTGFHGLHVLIGLLVLGIFAVLMFAAQKEDAVDTGLHAAAVYWHFVDAVWVVIFTVVYLWGVVL